ncbi:MAG: endonuclease/exonuclease/phosphatase (EEP) superfamily protein YafD [Bradymonadia bacterium]|jgi:endonuclease/exonuclease/phosphatase (EEP) superfamily protein YafD
MSAAEASTSNANKAKSSDAGGRPSIRESLTNAAVILAFPVYVGTLLPLLPGFWWADIFSNFRVQYALALAVGLVLVRSRKRVRIWVGTLLVWNLVAIAGLSFGAARGEAEENDTVVLSANLLSDNDNVQALISVIEAEQPDVIALLEFTPTWQAALGAIRAEYPYTIEDPRSDNFGIALLSREPLTGSIVEYGNAGMPSILATMSSGLTILATHPVPPLGGTCAAQRDSQFEAIANAVSGMSGVLVVGDFNATGFSRPFRRLQQEGGLKSAARRWSPTWPTHFPPLWIPLDHALVTDDVVVSDFRVARRVGSDHYPIVVRAR